MINTLIAIGAAHALYLTVLVLLKKRKRTSDYFLATYLAVLFTTYGLTFIAYEYSLANVGLLQLNISLLVAPLFFLYIRSMTASQPIRHYDVMIHMAFYVLTWVYWLYAFVSYSPVELESLLTVRPTEDSPLLFVLAILLESFAIPFYGALSLWVLRKHKRKISTTHSYLEGVDLKWGTIFVCSALCLWAAVATGDFFLTKENQLIDDRAIQIGYASTTMFIFLLGYFGLRQGHIALVDLQKTESPTSKREHATTIQQKKYQRSGLKANEAKAHYERLTQHMASHKPYLRSRLTLQDLAEEVNIPTNHLSQVINEQLGQTFYDFINKHRVKEFKQRVSQPGAKHYTLISIAYDSGFNAKSSFNRIFKKFEGCTPTQYMKRMQE